MTEKGRWWSLRAKCAALGFETRPRANDHVQTDSFRFENAWIQNTIEVTQIPKPLNSCVQSIIKTALSLGHPVQSGTGLEPFNLTGVEGVSGRDLLLGSVLVENLERKVLSGSELLQSEDGDLISSLNLVVIGLVLEPC
jgi:hypothetical protein